FDDVLAGEAGLVGALVLGAEENLAGNDEAAAAPFALFEDVAHYALCLAGGVALGVVEEVHARVVGGVHEFFGDGVADLVAEGHPRAEGERADFEAGVSEGAVEHGHGVARPWGRAAIPQGGSGGRARRVVQPSVSTA